MTIETKLIQKQSYIKLQIVEVKTGWSQILKNGEWVNSTFDTIHTVIVEFGKCFDEKSDVEKFMKTKMFKTIFKSCQNS